MTEGEPCGCQKRRGGEGGDRHELLKGLHWPGKTTLGRTGVSLMTSGKGMRDDKQSTSR